MAATDFFYTTLATFSQKEREQLVDYIRTQRENLLAARSEEARVRIVEDFIREVHDRMRPVKR